MEKTEAESTSALAPMRVQTFRSLWTASIASNFGGLIQGVGAAWMMTTIAESADMVALVQASSTLPIMLFSLMSGAVADSFSRRSVMLAAQIFMMTVSASLAICAWYDLLTPWLLLSFTFLIGCGGAFYNPAWQASVGDIVSKQLVPAAVLLNSVSFNVTRSVGPAIGGAIVAAAGAASAFAINSISYIGLISALWRWRPPQPDSTLPRERLASAMTTGVRYVAMSPSIAKILLRGFIFGLTTIVVLALLPLVARNVMDGSAFLYGVLLGAFGIGAVAGAFVSAPLRARLSNEVLVRWTFVTFAICASITGTSTSPWLTSPALILGGAAWVITLSLFNFSVQLSTPRWVVGRAMSLYQMAIFGGMALGSWLWGVVAELYSPGTALLYASGAMLLGALVGFRIPLPDKQSLNLEPLNRWQQPDVRLDVRPQSGPVAINVEYDIAEQSLAEFLQLMELRHRIRRRDGAQQWTLLRDTENPDLWVEQFELPTWLDYIRFHQRTTQADAHVSDGIRALHRGDGLPKVRRMLIRDPTRSQIDEVVREPVDLQ